MAQRRRVPGAPRRRAAQPLRHGPLCGLSGHPSRRHGVIQSNNVRNLNFLSDSGRYAVIPFEDEATLFCIDCLFKREDGERLRFFVDTLVEARDIVLKHHGR